jgi:hypothetical protein
MCGVKVAGGTTVEGFCWEQGMHSEELLHDKIIESGHG